VKLAELQRRFWRLVTAPESVAGALPRLADEDPGLAPLSGWIRAADEATAVQRLDVYANMYFFRLHGILRDDYPKISALVGPDRFHNLATSYLVAHPSRQPSVRHMGRHLAEHLAGHELTATWPALPDLARLEWARGEAFDAADAAPLAESALAAVPPERWPLLRLRLQPALRLLHLDHPAQRLWLALERGEPPPELAAAPTAVMVWRRGFRVYHRAVTPAEMAALEAAAAGDTFAALCERVAPHAGEADTPVVAVRALREWLAEEVLTSLELPP
jgi:hypothetical protein